MTRHYAGGMEAIIFVFVGSAIYLLGYFMGSRMNGRR